MKQTDERAFREFTNDFPDYVDRVIDQAADDLRIPKDKDVRRRVWEYVYLALMAKLRTSKARALARLPIAEWILMLVWHYSRVLRWKRKPRAPATRSKAIMARARARLAKRFPPEKEKRHAKP